MTFKKWKEVTFIAAIAVSLFSLYSCNNAASADNKNFNTLTINDEAKDSINKLRREIHADEKARMIDAIFKTNPAEKKLNGCVLIAQRGQIIYENAFGYADIKAKTPLTLNSEFQLSSTSKTLTAGAILLLSEQGKLQLTDVVEHYFPDFPYHNISIQMLLTHRSGLSNYVVDCEQYCSKPNLYNGCVFDNKAMMEILIKNKPKPFYVPNKKFEYCNTNYALLACIIEKVSGQPYDEFMTQNIFQPLGMNNTFVHNAKKDSLYKNKTIGHDASGRAEKVIYADDVVGDKGIYSTVEDMLKWDRALYSYELLKKETIDAAFTGYSNEHKGKKNYGYGWRIVDNGNNDKIVFHNGWWHGYNSTFYRRPKDETTIIILSNKDNRMAFQIKDLLPVLSAGGGEDLSGEE